MVLAFIFIFFFFLVSIRERPFGTGFSNLIFLASIR